jgi:hypothetical protein
MLSEPIVCCLCCLRFVVNGNRQSDKLEFTSFSQQIGHAPPPPPPTSVKGEGMATGTLCLHTRCLSLISIHSLKIAYLGLPQTASPSLCLWLQDRD